MSPEPRKPGERLLPEPRKRAERVFCFVASYTTLPNGQLQEPARVGEGISIYSVDETTGRMILLDGNLEHKGGSISANGIVPTANPSFCALSPDKKYLYVANETEPFGGVTAYRINTEALKKVDSVVFCEDDDEIEDMLGRENDTREKVNDSENLVNTDITMADGTPDTNRTLKPDGTPHKPFTFLTKINEVRAGGATCSVALNSTGTQLACANYCGGSVCLFNVREDGELEDCCEWMEFNVGGKVGKGSNLNQVPENAEGEMNGNAEGDHNETSSNTTAAKNKSSNLIGSATPLPSDKAPCLGPNEQRQEASHPHMVIFPPGNDRLILVPDLGCDCVRRVLIEEVEVTVVNDDGDESGRDGDLKDENDNRNNHTVNAKCKIRKRYNLTEVSPIQVDLSPNVENKNIEHRRSMLSTETACLEHTPDDNFLKPRHASLHPDKIGSGARHMVFQSKSVGSPDRIGSGAPVCYILNELGHWISSWMTVPGPENCSIPTKYEQLEQKCAEKLLLEEKCEKKCEKTSAEPEKEYRVTFQGSPITEFQQISTLPQEVLDPDPTDDRLTAGAVASVRRCTSADIHMTPCGRYLYTSQRGHDSIAMYQVDDNADLNQSNQTTLTSRLTSIGWHSVGETPRGFAITPCGNFLMVAGMNSHRIDTLKINREPDDLPEDQDANGGIPHSHWGTLENTGFSVNVNAPQRLQFLVL